MSKAKCPICFSAEAQNFGGGDVLVECPTCGQIRMSIAAVNELNQILPIDPIARAKVSCYFRQHVINGTEPLWIVTEYEYNEFKESQHTYLLLKDALAHFPATTAARVDLALQNLAKLQPYEGRLVPIYYNDYPALYATDFCYGLPLILELMKDSGYITVGRRELESDAYFIKLTATGWDRTRKFSKQTQELISIKEDGNVTTPNPRHVFVIHGRNTEVNKAMFDFLKSLDLKPLEWNQLKLGMKSPTPYTGDIVARAFEEGKAVIALITPDEKAELRSELKAVRDKGDDLGGYQARLNVYYELGWAMGKFEDRTIVVECGNVRQLSDTLGRHSVRFDNSREARQHLAELLQKAECAVDMRDGKWETAGNFESLENGEIDRPFDQGGGAARINDDDLWIYIKRHEPQVRAALQMFIVLEQHTVKFHYYTGMQLLVDTNLATVITSDIDAIAAPTLMHIESRFTLRPEVEKVLWAHQGEMLVDIEQNRIRFPHLWEGIAVQVIENFMTAAARPR